MRISADECFMTIAFTLARRSSCIRRSVGCVLVDQNNHIIGTGYNGGPKGAPHCVDHPCSGAGFESGSELGRCQAIHAEQNALMQCRDVMSINTLYTTTFPCEHCFKMIANTGCRKVVYFDDYPSSRVIVGELNSLLPKPIQLHQYITSKVIPDNAFSATISLYRDTDMASIASVLSAGSIR
jgi:dCMP deaminase